MTPAVSPEVRWSAVLWLLRLPLVGERELAAVLGVDEHIAASLLGELTALGWAEWLVSQSPELDAERVFYLTEQAVAAVAALGVTREQLGGSYAVGHRENLLRILRIETAIGLNRMLAGLASGLVDDKGLRLHDLRSLPWAAHRARWWPRQVEAYGCLASGGWQAPFFVAWDRAGAPAAHRRARVAAWYAFRDAPTNPWGHAPPPILVVCPTAAEANQWARIVSNSADRRGCDPLTLYLTTLSSIAEKSALGPIWRRVDGTLGLPVAERLRWTMRLPSCVEYVLDESRGPTALQSLRQPAERESTASAIALPFGRRTVSTATERLAQSAAKIGGVEKEILEWLGHHPYLSANDLSVLLNLGEGVVQKHLSNLEKPALVRSVLRRVEREDVASPRYFLTEDGLKLLAARDGVPPLRYVRRGVLAAEGTGVRNSGTRLAGLLRYFEHTVGANSFFVRLAAEAREPTRRASHRFVAWLSAAEGQEWFRWKDRSWHIWPDGRALYEVDGQRFDLLLEWDRGPMRRRDLEEKFRSYAMWLESRSMNPSESVRLLVVTTSNEKEHLMADLVQEASGNSRKLPALTCVTTRNRWQGSGALGASWRPIIYGGSLMSWWDQ